MISGKISPRPQQQVTLLSTKARKLAHARLAQRQASDDRWRDARFLWPLFNRS